MNGFDTGLEFYPPINLAGFKDTVRAYAPIGPSIVSVTFHTRPNSPVDPLAAILKTVPVIREVLDGEGLSQTRIAAHLTCKGAPIDQVGHIAGILWEAGVKDLVVLTGDLAEGETMPPGCYTSSTPLTEALFGQHPFNISVAGHPRFISDKDMDGLKRKLDAGATRIITQYDFETENYLRFEEKVRASNITAPVAYGVMPIGSFALVTKLAAAHNVFMPAAVAQRFSRHGGNLEAEEEEGRLFFGEQLQALAGGGAEDTHVYTLNRINPAMKVLPQFQRRNNATAAAYNLQKGIEP